MTCTGTVIFCPGCERQYRRKMVPIDFYNDAINLLTEIDQKFDVFGDLQTKIDRLLARSEATHDEG